MISKQALNAMSEDAETDEESELSRNDPRRHSVPVSPGEHLGDVLDSVKGLTPQDLEAAREELQSYEKKEKCDAYGHSIWILTLHQFEAWVTPKLQEWSKEAKSENLDLRETAEKTAVALEREDGRINLDRLGGNRSTPVGQHEYHDRYGAVRRRWAVVFPRQNDCSKKDGSLDRGRDHGLFRRGGPTRGSGPIDDQRRP